MQAVELRMAVTKIVEVLEKSDIRSVIDQYRSAKGDQRTAAAAKLGHAGAVIMERFDALSASERRVTQFLHIDSLGSADYWQNLLGSVGEPKRHQAEIVMLASRVMFAGNHLPGLIKMISDSKPTPGNASVDLPASLPGEGVLTIRLTDAGERASDPDRVARAIDGIDMLYSACASIARKPAMDLRIDALLAKRNKDRDLRFTGEQDSISAVYAVIDSIPAALSHIDPEQEIDLDSVVQSLPIFDDLRTLATLGTFSNKDLKDISETMHQGSLLTLESGVILVENQPEPIAQKPASRGEGVKGHTPPPSTDEHYDRYLREREAMLKPEASAQAQKTAPQVSSPPTLQPSSTGSKGLTDEQTRRQAVDELLKSLGQTRNT